jgi:hypothetical protein
MSPVNFEHLAKQNPKYQRALREVEAWINAHPHDRVLNPKMLRRDISKSSIADLAVALTLLEKAGLLRRVYKVVTPSGALADEDFDDPGNIPEKLPDRFENYFETSEADVIPIFRRIA